jgi:molybdopterin/thiamine biosynthesis adenylyltransferase
VAARHVGVIGFDQSIFSQSKITLVGAGGINGENGEGFVRKGIGKLDIFDGDDVELSNLNRQRFTRKEIGKNKAIGLARNLVREGYMGTILNAYPFFFQEALEKGTIPETDLIICAVDNEETRIFLSRYAIKNKLPAIFSAVSRDANQGYVFVQEPGKACFACAFPNTISNQITPCPNTPAIKDILKIVSGLALYAADTILMSRKRDWNFRMIYLAGFVPDENRRIAPNPDCPLCSATES